MGRASWLAIAIGVAFTGCSSSETSSSPKTSETQQVITSCVTMVSAADTYVRRWESHEKYGHRHHLRAGGDNESLVRFDLSAISPSATIESSTIAMYVVDDDSKAAVNLHRITAAWDESNTSYKSFGQQFDPATLGGFSPTKDLSRVTVDVTAQTQRWLTGAQPNDGLLFATASRHEVVMVSREGGSDAQKPQLTVCYSEPGNECSPNPCQNGGSCATDHNGFTCTCAPGWTGKVCDQEIDNCAANPCLNGGTCISELTGYVCMCPTGYTGTDCETLVDNCAGDPCQNGGTCVNQVGSYTCQCPAGYTGANCETLVDNCAPGPCLNGGVCTNGVGTYSCTCPVGFTGANCEINIDDCAGDPCQNGGTCIDGINSYTCACAAGWGGTNCEVNLDLCSQQPCLNGAQCIDGYGTYTCVCAAGFTGTNCDINIDDCASNPCQNGGVCVDGVNSYTCNCSPGYTGTNCETFGCATALDGTPCDDHNACTQSDSCQGGVCTGFNPIACTAIDQCHAAGVCDPVTAVCSNPVLPDGTACSDGNGCTIGDACNTGACAPGTPETCDGVCDPSTGVCTLFPPITVGAVTVGKDLETTTAIALGQPAPAGGIGVMLSSSDPTRMLLSTDPTAAGSASVLINVAEGATTSTTPVYVQGLVDSGTADLLATAPGYASQDAAVTLHASAFYLLSGDFTTSTLNTDVQLQVLAASIDPLTLAREATLPVRGGPGVDVAFSSSTPAVGVADPVHFTGGTSTNTTAFHALSGGTTTVALQEPAGFALPATGVSLVATVIEPSLTLQDVTVGQDLEAPELLVLGAPAPAGGVGVTITSADPTQVLVSSSATGVGSASIVLAVPEGETTVPAFYVQGLAATGTVALTATAAAFSPQTATVTLTRGGFFLSADTTNVTTLSTSPTLTITAAQLGTTGTMGAVQAVRGGLTAAIDLASSSPAVGTITLSPVQIAGGSTSGTSHFQPVGNGTSTISIDTPAGFSTPSTAQSVLETVRAPSFLVANASIGKNLELQQTYSLDSPAPSGGVTVTITSSDPSQLVLSAQGSVLGTPTLTFTIVSGQSIPPFFVEVLGDPGTAGVTLSAPGFAPKTATITIQPSGFFLQTGNFSTKTNSPNTSITLVASPIVNGTRAGTQALRPGVAAAIDITSGTPGVGTITISPVNWSASATTATTQFHPVASGTTTISIDTPAGFTTPATGQSITATVQ